jgi:hypothetical protein
VEVPPLATISSPSSYETTVKVALEELFALLEDYGPIWYTEEHRKRALKALRAR